MLHIPQSTLLRISEDILIRESHMDVVFLQYSVHVVLPNTSFIISTEPELIKVYPAVYYVLCYAAK
jgi:hypothetical protein